MGIAPESGDSGPGVELEILDEGDHAHVGSGLVVPAPTIRAGHPGPVIQCALGSLARNGGGQDAVLNHVADLQVAYVGARLPVHSHSLAGQ
jgi:hypothetical protein